MSPNPLLTRHTSTTLAPEFFALPPRGGDPHFGLSRSSYYDLERRGLIRFVRIRKPGQQRGKVLVAFNDMTALMRRFQRPDGGRP
jgi:hypothetical protein